LQEAREIGKKINFGIANVNVQYAKSVQYELEEMGHHCTVLNAEWKSIEQIVCAIVLREELNIRLKKTKQTMNRNEQVKYVQQWRKDNEAFLTTEFGLPDSLNTKLFVRGVMFATSTSKHAVPLLHDVFQADGAHSQFGKYILYSAYGTTANGNMSPVAFGLFFGNEDKKNWATFWEFVHTVHPSLDDPRKTIVTDQDKGCMSSFDDTLEHSAQFMCSFHCRQNIIKNCGGGKGKIPHSALWVYNMLGSCTNIQT
jgi:hypothetical protein